MPEGARVLVVEDDSGNQVVMRRILEKLGCECQIAGNGLEAIDALENGRFDIAFMDCEMPVLDGIQAVKTIRASAKQYARMPIVAVTARAIEGDQKLCLSAGMDAYIAKPVGMAEVQQAIQNYVRPAFAG
jgi:CheY-like chemotaxis protein